MCLGWEPRTHNAPVKNEEAFIPIAFQAMSTLIITIYFFPPPPGKEIEILGLDRGLFEVICGCPDRPNCWPPEWTLLWPVKWVGQSHQYLNAVCHLFRMKTEENSAWQGKTPGKSNRVFVTVTSAWRSSSPGCWSQWLHIVSIPSLYVPRRGRLKVQKSQLFGKVPAYKPKLYPSFPSDSNLGYHITRFSLHRETRYGKNISKNFLPKQGCSQECTF